MAQAQSEYSHQDPQQPPEQLSLHSLRPSCWVQPLDLGISRFHKPSPELTKFSIYMCNELTFV